MTDLVPALSAYADSGCLGSAGGYVSAVRVGANGHELRPEDCTESARPGSGDVRVPSVGERVGVRVAR
jgi:hypothetical protein